LIKEKGRPLRLDAYSFARAAVLLLLVVELTNSSAKAEGIPSRLNRAAYFAASGKNAAFPVKGSDGHLALLFVDLQSDKLRKLGIKGSDLLSPYLSADGARLFFTRHPDGQTGSELIRCDTVSFACKSLLRSEGRISTPIEIEDRRILYVSSLYHVGLDRKGRYSRNDFWLFDEVSGPRKLTDMKLYQISSISVTNDSVYFSAYGPAPEHPAVPKEDPDAPRQSDIFKLPFDPVQGKIQSPSHVLTPLFLAEGKARSPAVSSDGSFIAFLRTRLGIGNYRYELVVRDEDSHTERLIPTNGLGFSRPVVVDHSVYTNSIDISRYSIQFVVAGQQEPKLVADIDDLSIDSLDLMELSIEQ
jgi:WD40-like Beta Propeller Repeat